MNLQNIKEEQADQHDNVCGTLYHIHVVFVELRWQVETHLQKCMCLQDVFNVLIECIM